MEGEGGGARRRRRTGREVGSKGGIASEMEESSRDGLRAEKSM